MKKSRFSEARGPLAGGVRSVCEEWSGELASRWEWGWLIVRRTRKEFS